MAETYTQKNSPMRFKAESLGDDDLLITNLSGSESLSGLFWFDLEGSKAHFRAYPWSKQGDVVNWLTSDIFGLKQARASQLLRAAAVTLSSRSNRFITGSESTVQPPRAAHRACQPDTAPIRAD